MKSVVTWEELWNFSGLKLQNLFGICSTNQEEKRRSLMHFCSNTMLLNIRAKKQMEITNITINFRSKSLPKWNSKSFVIQDQMCSITELLKEVTYEVGGVIPILNKSTKLLGSTIWLESSKYDIYIWEGSEELLAHWPICHDAKKNIFWICNW